MVSRPGTFSPQEADRRIYTRDSVSGTQGERQGMSRGHRPEAGLRGEGSANATGRGCWLASAGRSVGLSPRNMPASEPPCSLFETS